MNLNQAGSCKCMKYDNHNKQNERRGANSPILTSKIRHYDVMPVYYDFWK